MSEQEVSEDEVSEEEVSLSVEVSLSEEEKRRVVCRIIVEVRRFEGHLKVHVEICFS